jgi:Lrp/AsnC family transcriptional regulator for asnA, asnC and gidA
MRDQKDARQGLAGLMSGSEAQERQLDDVDATDVAIVRLLQENGRLPNARIARELGLSEPTVRKRIERLMQDDIIKVVAVLNPRKTGYVTDVLIGLRTETGRMMEVGAKLAQNERVVYLGYVAGQYDILVEMLFRNDSELLEFLNTEMSRLGGVTSMDTSHVLRTGRINYDWKLPADYLPARGTAKGGQGAAGEDR